MLKYQKTVEVYKRLSFKQSWVESSTETSMVEVENDQALITSGVKLITTIGGYKQIELSSDTLTKTVTYFKRL